MTRQARVAKRSVGFALVNLVVLGSLTAPVVTGLPLAIAALEPEGGRASALATVVTWGAVAAVVSNPVFGFLSDRTRGRFGRRRPWILGGVVVGLAASLLITVADSVPALAAAWVLAQVAYNAALAAVAGMLGDQVPEGERASASGLFAGAAFVGTLPPLVLAVLLPTRPDVVLLAMPTAALVVGVGFCLLAPDPQRPRPARRADVPGDDGLRAPARWRAAVAPRAPGFAAVWLQRFVMQLAFSLMTSFTLFFVSDRFDVAPRAAGSVVAIATIVGGAAVVVAAVSAGFLAGRRGRYGPYLAGAAGGLAVAGLVRAFGADSAHLWISSLVGGLAIGTFFAVDFALALRAIPAINTGGYLGVLNVAETLPQTIAPVVALLVLGVGGGDPFSSSGDNYLLLYAVAAATALAALLPMRWLRSVLNRESSAA